MTKTQLGWLIFAAALLSMITLLAGDLMTLWKSNGTVDFAFVRGVLQHVGSTVAAFGGGVLVDRNAAAQKVSEEKRAELAHL